MFRIFNKIKRPLQLIIPIIFLGFLFAVYKNENERMKYKVQENRIIYNNFKRRTLDILKDNWETSHYDFKLLNRVTFLMNNDNYAQNIFVCFLAASTRFYNVPEIINKYINYINTNPGIWMLITIFMLGIIRGYIPAIDTFELAICSLFCTYLMKIFDLYRNNI
jgi:hypothetical protein